MFKLESYITPYILAYLDKYFKNFNPANFQVSLWTGGASFYNLDLNLEVLEEEFHLPVTFVSGHIHELRLFVPWTKITSEPIVVNVNTIEITLKLKKDGDAPTAASKPTTVTSPKTKLPSEPEEAPGYVQSLVNKMVNNIRIDCHNVIVKLVEEDIVFTLNVKTASLSPMDRDWQPSFIDLSPTEFVLRRQLSFSDLTVCLDRTNSAGKIERYLEPLLYRCSFSIRIFQQYFNQFAMRPFFTRVDVYSETVSFTITDEQIPMLLRLYNMILAVKNNIATTHISEPPSDPYTCIKIPQEGGGGCEEEEDPVMSWAAWAVGWVPDIPGAILGAVETEEMDEDEDTPDITSHLGLYANKVSIVFKGMEAVAEKKNSSGATRVKFQPFLKCQLQGLICDIVNRGTESNTFAGVCEILVEGMQSCPCGMKDCYLENMGEVKTNEYLKIGTPSLDFANNGLFEDGANIEPPSDALFQFENRAEIFNEEMMLDRAPAVALELMSTVRYEMTPEETRSHHSSGSTADASWDLSSDKLLCRLVVAPFILKLCSGSIHRLKMILFSAAQYDVELPTLPPQQSPPKSSESADLTGIKNIDGAFNIYQFTIIRPHIEIVAGDHLDFDQRTQIRAKYKRRKAATLAPLSDVLPEWPRLIVTLSCIDGRIVDPNGSFHKLMKRPGVFPVNVLDSFSQRLSAKVFNAEVKLRSDKFVVPISIPFNIEFSFFSAVRPELYPSKFDPVSKLNLDLEDFRINLAKPHLMLMQVIAVSCYDERMSEHLTSSTILRDLPNYNQGDIVLHIQELSIEAVFTQVLHTTRTRIGSLGIFIHSPHDPSPIPIFEGPPNSSPDPEGLAVIIIQYPVRLLDEISNQQGTSDPSKTSDINEMTPLLMVNISSFQLQFELVFFQWLSYHPRQMPSSIPSAIQSSSLNVYPMVPASRTSSRHSVASKAQSSWSTSDENNVIGSVTGKDFQQLYNPQQQQQTAESASSIVDNEQSQHNDEEEEALLLENIQRTRRKSTLEEEFRLTFSLDFYLETWNKWVLTHLSVIMKSFIVVDIGQADLWFPIGSQQHSFGSFISEASSGANGILVVTPKISALPEGPRMKLALSKVSLPVELPVEFKGKELYPVRITAENMTIFTSHVKEGKLPLSLPLNLVLTLTLSEKKVEGKPSVIAAFLHTDIPALKYSVSYSQINLLIRLMEQSLHTTAKLLRKSGSLMLSPIESTDLELPEFSSDNQSEARNKRIDPGSVGSGKPAFAQQHSEIVSLSENLESQNIAESVDSNFKAGLPQVEGPQEAKTSVWFQVTIAQLQLIITNSPIQQGRVDQLVLEMEDIVSSLDAQAVFIKWSLKMNNVSCRSYERTSEDRWDLGKCLGIILTSNEEITRDINILRGSGSKRQSTFSMSNPNASAREKSSSATTSVPKSRGILNFTFTCVQTKNFHRKSELSPVMRWNSAIKKHRERTKESRYDFYENEDERYLSEFDVKVGSFDVLLDLAVLSPYTRILNLVSSANFPPVEDYQSEMPFYSNTTLPLIYLETGAVRFFVKTLLPSKARAETPDVLAFCVNSMAIHSQSENPLTRTVVNKDLYRIAESTNILEVPGAPVEDRQYLLDLSGTSIFTLNWKDLKANSRELLPSPTSTVLKTMNENPALEWNTTRTDLITDEVLGHPILERLDLSIAFAPAIVYEANATKIDRHIVVAGHALEMNAASEVSIYINLHQIACLQGIAVDLSDMMEECFAGFPVDSKEEIVALNFMKESDSGIDSIVASTVENVDHLVRQTSSEVIGMMKQGRMMDGVGGKQDEVVVPFDLLVTGSMFQVMTFDTKHRAGGSESDNGRNNGKIIGVVPLVFCAAGQPHFVLSLNDTKQRAEVSIFELIVGFASAEKRTIHHFSLPTVSDYPERLFESTPGERNPKTGMIPAFFTAKFTDFLTRPFEVSSEFACPIKISMNRQTIKNLLRVENYFASVPWKISSSEKPRIVTPSPEVSSKQEQHILNRMCACRVAFNQVVFTIVEEVEEELPRSSAALSFSSCSVGLQSRVKNSSLAANEEYVVPDNVSVDLKVCSLTLATGIGARRDVIMTPWDMEMKARFRWKPYRATPSITASFHADPLSLYVGPQNILGILQLQQTFGNYLFDFIDYQEEKIERIMHATPGETNLPIEEYEDDLRSGSFMYVHKDNSYELPEVYRIAFCEKHRTMTWRYPHKRVLTRVECAPVPLDFDMLPNLKDKELPCIVEYFDEAQNKFCHFGIIYLSESAKGVLRTPEKDKLHLFTSSVWRVVIEAPLNESDSLNLVKPEILAASLRVDSLQDPSLNPRLKLYFSFPKISINFINQLTYAGKDPGDQLKFYSFGGLTLPDQPFGTFELETTTLTVSFWLLRCRLELNTFMRHTITEYGYLTSVPVIEPVNMNALYTVSQTSLKDNKARVKLELSTKPINLKLSASVLHTMTASLTTWLQVLENYNGYVVDLDKYHSKKLVHLAEVLICNDLHADILVNQLKVSEGQWSSSDTFQSIGCRECYSFVWPSQKNGPLCKISVRDPDWKASDIISFHRLGYRLVNIAKSSHKLFMNVNKFSGCQKIVTISGPFSVVNAMDGVIEIALLPKSGGREVTWPVQSKSHGPSRLIEVSSIEHFRFRFAEDNSQTLPWSEVVTIEDMKKEKSRAIPIELYRQNEGGNLKSFSMWCSFVEETIDGFSRCVVIISPFFRVQSSLATPTSVHNSVGRSIPDEPFELPGRGSEQQIEFSGSHKVVHHLTFQSSPNVSQSSPPIPLAPGGPLTDKTIVSRPIDQIIADILAESSSSSSASGIQVENERPNEDKWPYVADDIKITEWVECVQPDTVVEVGFSSWIQGLPTVLVDVKPWALFVNLTGHPVSFLEVVDAEEVAFVIPAMAVLTPPKIKDAFRLGFESGNTTYWTNPMEFTEQKSRLDIHYINDNWKIPIDCFSRLEIIGRNEVCYMTLETRIRKEILVFTLRATFAIQNKLESWLLVKGISLHTPNPEDSSDWKNIDAFTLLDPVSTKKNKSRGSYLPLLVYYSDKTDEEFCEDEDDYYQVTDLAAMKFLALSCGGPWWFVQLMKFDLLFNHMSAVDGLLGKRTAVALPKYSPVSDEVVGGKLNADYEEAAIPIVISWTAKNGQVWISVTPDKSPQLTVYNRTGQALFYAQASPMPGVPMPDTENFDQFSYLPGYSKSFYTFRGTYAKFPQLIPQGQLGSLILAKLPEGAGNGASFFHEKNLIYSGIFEWSKPIRIDGPIQSVQIADTLGVKVTVEQLGLRRHIYIENLSSVEISAKDIRHRICGMKIDEASTSEGKGAGGDRHQKYISASTDTSDEQLQDENRGSKSVAVMAQEETFYLPIEFMVYVPWLRVIVLSNVNEQAKQHEVLSLSFQDVLAQRYFEVKHVKLRALENEELRNCLLHVTIGDMEIDTPPFEDKKSDFAVVLRQDGAYISLFSPPHEGFNIFADPPLNLPTKPMIDLTATFGMTSSMDQELQQVHVKLEPLEVFVDRHLIEDVMPIFMEVISLVEERSTEITWLLAALPAATEVPNKNQAANESNRSIQQVASGSKMQEFIAAAPLCAGPNPSMMMKKSVIVTLRQDLDKIHQEIRENRRYHEVRNVRLSVVDEPANKSEEIEVEVEENLGASSSVTSVESSSQLNEEGAKGAVLLLDLQEPDQADENNFCGFASRQPWTFLNSPLDVDNILQEFAEPLKLERFEIAPLKIYGSVRFKYGMYLAFDRAAVDIKEFAANSVITTHYGMGTVIGKHYWQSIVFGYKNMISGVGSWEGVGSPTRLVGEVSTGLRDLVVYPYQGIFKGPTGFFVGIGKGCSSMVKHIAAGTLSSVTNGAWTWSRNLDALTQDDEDRRKDVQGVTDGIAQGFASLGVRMLGAVGGIAHYPIQSIINGPTPKNIATGVAKGVVSVVTKPVGGALELLAMTGEGILKGTGWSSENKTKFKPVAEEVTGASSSPLKYHTKIIIEEQEQRVLLVIDAAQPQPSNKALTPVTLVVTTENVYIFNCNTDEIQDQIPINSLAVAACKDRNMLCLRKASEKKMDDVSVAEERVIEFVRGFASAHSLPAIDETTEVNIQVPSVTEINTNDTASTSAAAYCNPDGYGDFFVDPNSKVEFINVLTWVQKISSGEFYGSG